MKTRFIFIFALAIVAGSALGDEQLRRIQEELRKRNLYFGEIDGQKTEETKRALRQFQQRKGFQVTGYPDGDTLNALNLADLAGPSPGTTTAGEQWPDLPVLKSDAARELKEEDKKFLESLDPIGEPPPEEPIPAPAEQPPDRKRPSAPARETVPPARQSDSRPPESLPPKPATGDGPGSRDPIIPSEKVGDFVKTYLDACERNQLSSETAYYADRVKYFDHGLVSRDFIERDVAAFYRRWPERDYELLDCKVLQSSSDEAVVKFRIAFRYRSPQHAVSGKTDNVFTVRRTGEGMKFTTLREQRLRN